MSSIYDEYEGEIKQYILEGYNIKEISKKLNEEHGMYGCYNGFYDFCRRHGIVAKAERHCKNCQNCDTYLNMDNGYKVRVCNAEKAVINAKYVPRWCNDRFEKKR